MEGGSGLVDRDGVALQGGQGQVAQQQAAVGVRVGAETAAALGQAVEDLCGGPAVLVEQFLRAVGAQPGFQLGEVGGVGADLVERDLVGAPGALDRHAVHLVRAGPALGGAQDDHRPVRAPGGAVGAGLVLDGGDPVEGGVHGCGHRAVHGHRVRAGDVQRVVAVAAQQGVQLRLGQAGEHRRVGDLVAVQVQDRQHRPVVHRVQELVAVPGGGERAGLRLAVPDHAGDQQGGVVEGGAVGVREGVSEFAALVDGAGGLGGDVAGHAAGEGELPEELRHALGVPGDGRVGVGVAAVQPGAGQHGRASVAGAPDADGVQVAPGDHPVEVGVHEVQARRGPPVAQQPGLDVLRAQRLVQQRVGHQVDLTGREVVGGPPVGVERPQLGLGGLCGR